MSARQHMTMHELTALVNGTVQRVEKMETERKPIDHHPDDERWDCERCGQLLALRDVQSGRLRFQVREHNVSFVPDFAQPVETKCKRCGWLNHLTS